MEVDQKQNECKRADPTIQTVQTVHKSTTTYQPTVRCVKAAEQNGEEIWETELELGLHHVTLHMLLDGLNVWLWEPKSRLDLAVCHAAVAWKICSAPTIRSAVPSFGATALAHQLGDRDKGRFGLGSVVGYFILFRLLTSFEPY